jgi:hypothetical protein
MLPLSSGQKSSSFTMLISGYCWNGVLTPTRTPQFVASQMVVNDIFSATRTSGLNTNSPIHLLLDLHSRNIPEFRRQCNLVQVKIEH